MKKILLFLLCLVILYGLTIFLAPEISSRLEKTIWFSWTTDSIRNFKSQFDDVVTDIPSVDEFKTGAEDVKNTLQDWLNTTKWKIDSVRSTFSWAQDTINETFDTIDWAIETVKNARETVDDLSKKTESLQNLWDILQWSVNTEILSTSSGEIISNQ